MYDSIRNPENIKVFFAGSESNAHSVLCKHAEVKYGLWTCYNFIAKPLGLKYYPQIPKVSDEIAISTAETSFDYSIMDSGVFTLMFGALKGEKDRKFIEIWYNALVKFVIDNNIRSTLVEVDCQKILGASEAWEYRKRLRNDLPENRQINVFHLEDGIKGLDRLIEFSDYIAVGAPELRRAFGQTDYKEAIYRLVYHIKERKDNIDIHLLGCTDKEVLKKCADCTSADSTSYLSVNRHGHILGNRTKTLNEKAKNLYEEKISRAIKEVQNNIERELSEGLKNDIRTKLISAVIYKEFYATHCGSQE